MLGALALVAAAIAFSWWRASRAERERKFEPAGKLRW